MIRDIHGKYYVVSPKSKKLYVVDHDLKCTCLGFKRWQHCHHQHDVWHYIESGETVDVARASGGQRKW